MVDNSNLPLVSRKDTFDPQTRSLLRLYKAIFCYQNNFTIKAGNFSQYFQEISLFPIQATDSDTCWPKTG